MADGKVTISTELDDSGAKQGISKLSGTLQKVDSVGATALKGTVAAIGTATTAVGVLVGKSVQAYSSYEQLVGGVQTLFGAQGYSLEEYAKEVGKNVADVKDKYNSLVSAESTVMDNAAKAFQTAGLSMNDYMEQITGFSASLVQSLGGDTEKAAAVGNRAIIDMSDNANKMGTNIADIQHAYQGFAKQNYTMLDNLKLGYGGTKTEMERLVEDASKMTDIQESLGVTVEKGSLSFGNIINAISVTQKSLGVAGTTSKEAATTIEGSCNSMKAAWTNLVTGMARDDADIDTLIEQFVTSVDTYASNMMPRIEKAIGGAGEVIQNLMPKVVERIPSLITEALPQLVIAGTQLVTSLGKGIVDNIPTLLSYLSELYTEIVSFLNQNGSSISSTMSEKVTEVVNTISKKLPELIPELMEKILSGIQNIGDFLSVATPKFLDMGAKLIHSIAQGISNGLPVLIQKLPTIISTFANIINDNAPKILKIGVDIIITLAKGIIKSIPTLVKNIPKIISAIVDVFLAFQWATLGKSVIKGITNGIKSLSGKVSEAGSNILKNLTESLDKLPETLLKLGKTAISKFHSGITSVFSKIKVASTELGSKVLSGVKEIPSKIVSVGKDIVNGLLNGIKAGWENLTGKVGSLCSSLISSIKKKFDIHSPSKVMKNEVGKQIDLGLSQGISENEKSVLKSVDSLGNKVLAAFKKSMSKEDFKKSGSKLVDKLTEGIEENISKFNDKVKEIQETYQSAIDDITSKRDDLAQSLKGMGSGLFTEDENGNIILSNLSEQTKEVKKFGKNLNKLKGTISDDLMNEILEMDADTAYKYTNALLALSSEELKAYDEAYLSKIKASNAIAKKWYADDLKTLETEYTSKVNKQFNNLVKNVSAAGNNALKGFLKPFKNSKTVTSALSDFCDNVVKTIKKKFDIHSPSRVFANIGEMNALGLVEGFNNIDPMRQINANVESGLQHLNDSLNTEMIINSQIDYNKLGKATAQAISDSGLGIKVDGREFGRVIRRLQ